MWIANVVFGGPNLDYLCVTASDKVWRRTCGGKAFCRGSRQAAEAWTLSMDGPLLRRALTLWLVMMGAETLHGIARTLFLVSWTGDARSREIGVFTGSAILFAIVWWRSRWLRAEGAVWLVGGLWTVLTVGFEFGLSRLVGRSWSDVLADYRILDGGLMPLGLAILFAAPAIAASLQRPRL